MESKARIRQALNWSMGFKVYSSKKKEEEKMTVVVAKKFKDRIDIACDSQCSLWMLKFNVDVPKIVRYKNGVVVWSSGLIVDIKKFRRMFEDWVDINNLRELDDLMDWFTDKELNCRMIIIAKEKAYTVEFYDNGKYNSHEIEEHDVIGSGEFAARVALDFTDNVERAVQSAINHAEWCGGKIVKKTIKFK